jgi:hypothetical protein
MDFFRIGFRWYGTRQSPVETLSEALRSFCGSGLDALILVNFVVRK